MVVSDDPRKLPADVATHGTFDAVPALLRVVCEITGMRFAAVARVNDAAWTPYAVQDDINLGWTTGALHAVNTTWALDSHALREPVIIVQASLDPRLSDAEATMLRPIESYISVPIKLADGLYFGLLFALDPAPARLSQAGLLSLFEQFAEIIALQIEGQSVREHEQRLLLAERAAAQLREQFIAILGHDLRNPLHAVYASGDLLEHKLTDPSLLAFASRIKTNVRRMSSLIDDVLDFARGRLGGGIAVELTEIENVDPGLMMVVQELRDAYPKCQIISNISVNRPVRCDLGRLQQVASNLLGNALTHGDRSGPVSISARAHDNDLVLEVWNGGKPIPSENLGRIFEPFWRPSESTRHGVGLGLYICSSIVRSHHGQIAVTSSAEQGTLFTARMPLGTRPPTQHAARGAENPEARERPSTGGASTSV